MAARVEALASQINPHFLFNTLTSISSLIRSQPETARMLIVKLSGLLRRLLRSQEHFVTLREELEAIDEYLDIESIRFGPRLRDREGTSIRPASTSSSRACCCSRWSRTRSSTGCRRRSARAASPSAERPPERPRDHRRHRQRRRRHRRRTPSACKGGGIGLRNVNERLQVIYGANYQLQLDSVPGEGTCARIVIPELRGAGADDARDGQRRRALCAPSSSTTSSWRGTSCVSCSARSAGSRSSGRPPTGSRRCASSRSTSPDLVMLDVQMPGLTGLRGRPAAVRGRRSTPQLVFVTAFDQYAIEAFEVNAVDYLLKPVEAGAAGDGRRPGPDAGWRPSAAVARPSAATWTGSLQLLSERQERREQLAVKVGRPVPADPGRRGGPRLGRGRRDHGCNEQLVRNVQLSDTG